MDRDVPMSRNLEARQFVVEKLKHHDGLTRNELLEHARAAGRRPVDVDEAVAHLLKRGDLVARDAPGQRGQVLATT